MKPEIPITWPHDGNAIIPQVFADPWICTEESALFIAWVNPGWGTVLYVELFHALN